MKRRKEKKELVIVRYNSNSTQITICTFVLRYMLDGHYDKQMIQCYQFNFPKTLNTAVCIVCMQQTRPDSLLHSQNIRHENTHFCIDFYKRRTMRISKHFNVIYLKLDEIYKLRKKSVEKQQQQQQRPQRCRRRRRKRLLCVEFFPFISMVSIG